MKEEGKERRKGKRGGKEAKGSERKKEDLTREKTGRGREVCGLERDSVTEMNRM